MIRALQTSIRSNKDVISLDIIYHAKQHFFKLKITNNELETLIKNRLHDVIEKLLEANTLLSNDVIFWVKYAQNKRRALVSTMAKVKNLSNKSRQKPSILQECFRTMPKRTSKSLISYSII